MTFFQSLNKGYKRLFTKGDSAGDWATQALGYWSFKFGDNNEYEVTFEPISKNRFHVGVYKNGLCLTEKIPVRPDGVEQYLS